MAWITNNEANDIVREMGGLFFPFDRGKDNVFDATSQEDIS
jgi:hypothetical protein